MKCHSVTSFREFTYYVNGYFYCIKMIVHKCGQLMNLWQCNVKMSICFFVTYTKLLIIDERVE